MLEHPKILQRLVDLDGEGLNVYMASQLQDPPIEYINLFPDYLHYRGGEFVQDILLIAKPAYQLVVNMTDPKIICVPEGGRIDDNIRARSGFNPYFVEPGKEKLNRFFDTGLANECLSISLRIPQAQDCQAQEAHP